MQSSLIGGDIFTWPEILDRKWESLELLQKPFTLGIMISNLYKLNPKVPSKYKGQAIGIPLACGALPLAPLLLTNYQETGLSITTGSPQIFHDDSTNVEFRIDGLVQERLNSSALAMELCLSCIDPLICDISFFTCRSISHIKWE